MNLKIRILSGILAGSMLCSFVPVKAIGDEPTDINIVEEYMSYMYNANDVWAAFFYLAGKHMSCIYGTVGSTKLYNVLVDLKIKMQGINFSDKILEESVDGLFCIHEARFKEYCGLFEDAQISYETALSKYTSLVSRESRLNIKSCLEEIKCFCEERAYYCGGRKTSNERWVMFKFLSPIWGLFNMEVKDKKQEKEKLEIYVNFMGNSMFFLKDACKRFPTFKNSLLWKIDGMNKMVEVYKKEKNFLKAWEMQQLSDQIMSIVRLLKSDVPNT